MKQIDINVLHVSQMIVTAPCLSLCFDYVTIYIMYFFPGSGRMNHSFIPYSVRHCEFYIEWKVCIVLVRCLISRKPSARVASGKPAALFAKRSLGWVWVMGFVRAGFRKPAWYRKVGINGMQYEPDLGF